MKASTDLERLILFLDQLSALRDPYMSDHAARVMDLTVRLSERIDFPHPKRKALTHAALLHDLGKVAIPEGILNKPSRLTTAEYWMVQQHTVLGHRLIQPLEIDPMIGNAILHHHENFDGSGYPRGLAGEAIPFEARIIRITDHYDALLSPRSYRSAFTAAAARELLLKDRSCFDPYLLKEFLIIIEAAHGQAKEPFVK